MSNDLACRCCHRWCRRADIQCRFQAQRGGHDAADSSAVPGPPQGCHHTNQWQESRQLCLRSQAAVSAGNQRASLSWDQLSQIQPVKCSTTKMQLSSSLHILCSMLNAGHTNAVRVVPSDLQNPSCVLEHAVQYPCISQTCCLHTSRQKA